MIKFVQRDKAWPIYELHIFELRDEEISPISQRYGRVRIPASLKIFGLTFLSDISCVFNCVDHLLYVYVIVLFFVLLFFTSCLSHGCVTISFSDKRLKEAKLLSMEQRRYHAVPEM